MAAHSRPSWTPELDLRRGRPATPQAPWRARALLCWGTGRPGRGPTEQEETEVVLFCSFTPKSLYSCLSQGVSEAEIQG